MLLPFKIYCLVLACIRAIIHIRPLSFCHDKANLQENSYIRFLTTINFDLSDFEPPRSLLTLDRQRRVHEVEQGRRVLCLSSILFVFPGFQTICMVTFSSVPTWNPAKRCIVALRYPRLRVQVSNENMLKSLYTVKKSRPFSRPQPVCHWLNSSWAGII